MLAFSNLTEVAGSKENLNVQNVLIKYLYISECTRHLFCGSRSNLFLNFVGISDFVKR
jgi:hypothetical protein